MPKQADWITDMNGNLTLTLSARVSPNTGDFRLEQNGKRIGHGVVKPPHIGQGICEKMIQAVVMAPESAEEGEADE